MRLHSLLCCQAGFYAWGARRRILNAMGSATGDEMQLFALNCNQGILCRGGKLHAARLDIGATNQGVHLTHLEVAGLCMMPILLAYRGQCPTLSAAACLHNSLTLA